MAAVAKPTISATPFVVVAVSLIESVSTVTLSPMLRDVPAALRGAQKVEAIFPQKKGKSPVKKTGEDLRNGGKK